jgi:hypothetical protein
MSTKLDLNQCTSRQLSAIPGIDESLADAITATRRTRKKFQHIDQLWKVSGMTRVKFRIMLRYAEVVGQKAQPVGTVPYYVPSKQFVAIPSSRAPIVWKTPRAKSRNKKANIINTVIEVSGVALEDQFKRPTMPTAGGGGRSVPVPPVRYLASPLPKRPQTVLCSSSNRARTPSAKPAVPNRSVEQKPIVLPRVMDEITKQKQLVKQGKGKDTPAEKLDISKSGNRLTLTYRFEDDRVNIPNTVILRAKSANPKSNEKPVKDAWGLTQPRSQQGGESPNRSGDVRHPGQNAVPLSSDNLAMHEAALSEEEQAPGSRQRSVESWVNTQSERPFRSAGPGSPGPDGNIKAEDKPKKPHARRSCHFYSSPGPPAGPATTFPSLQERRSPAYRRDEQGTGQSKEVTRATAGDEYHHQACQAYFVYGQQEVPTNAEYVQNYDDESVPESPEGGETAPGRRKTKSAVRDNYHKSDRYRDR